ncbi:hypothetical protein [Bythopirellula goksoeyrii]|uniref:Uncharacterized protein n=1 Tax=Bythopirellula goksoeyrii TaxID=1400387 RepID=A0A5B9QVK6_9BACT|nr:hypothetical protein [Bythopirellula goksoeyrii]QEG37963.1 hypothetical protein Pr1d_53110 [Bythopirellula goksoeyrii]
MDIFEGDRHDPLSATYQTIEFARLNDVLKECGINDMELRRKICETYFFSSGYFLDSGWFAEEDSRYQPGIYFSEVNDLNQPTKSIFLPDSSVGTMFHEYAFGTSAWLYEDHNEDASEIEIGDVNDTI